MPLYVDVIPTLTVTDETVMDPAALNQLGTPTVHITGTLDGTSTVSIGAGTVENSMLANMEANTVKGRDESTGVPVDLTMHSSMDIASGALKVADGGITTTQLASAATTAAGAIADVNIATGIIGANKLKAQAALTLLGNGGDTASAAPEPILIGTGLTVTNADEIDTATRSRTANVATITTGSAHSYAVGDKINVTGLGGTGYTAYGATTLSGTTGSTIVYASVNVDGNGDPITEGSVSDTGGKVRRIEAAGTPTSTISNTQPGVFAWVRFNGGVSPGSGAYYSYASTPQSYSKTGTTVTVTIASSRQHGLIVGSIVYIVYVGTGTTGAKTITGVPSNSSFTYEDSTPASSGTLNIHSGIIDSYNVSYVLRDGAGVYQIYFTTSPTSGRKPVVSGSCQYYYGDPCHGRLNCAHHSATALSGGSINGDDNLSGIAKVICTDYLGTTAQDQMCVDVIICSV